MSTTSRFENAGVVVDTLNIIVLIGAMLASHEARRRFTTMRMRLPGWASFVIDMNERVGLPFPQIELTPGIVEV